MSGLRILHVHPRLIGSVKNWSGKDSDAGTSWLVEHAKSMNFNTIWFSPLFKTSDIIMHRHGQNLSGSLYASKSHSLLDRDFTAAAQGTTRDQQRKLDDEHIRHFSAEAEKCGIRVMGDLVLNHVAMDHPLLLQENRKIKELKKTTHNHRPIYNNGTVIGITYDTATAQNKNFLFKFNRNAQFNLIIPGAGNETWDDVAQINYNSPEAMDYFVNGKNGQKGYWKKVIDWHLDRGFSGFRCDVAYKIPPAVWSNLSQYTHNRREDAVFMAETLGDNGCADALKNAEITVKGRTQKAFDLSMLGLYWWNMKDSWIMNENKRMQQISQFGGAGFPDNHDTPNTIAAHFMQAFSYITDEKERMHKVAYICVRNYAVAALLCNSVYMQLGYEYGRNQITVFRNSQYQKYWQDLVTQRSDPSHQLNLISRIKAINDFKAQLANANAIVRMTNVVPCGSHNRLLKIECALEDHDSGQDLGNMIVYINEQPELGPVTIKNKDLVDDQNTTLKRLVLGGVDGITTDTHIIKDVAAFYTPLTAAQPPQAPILQNLPRLVA